MKILMQIHIFHFLCLFLMVYCVTSASVPQTANLETLHGILEPIDGQGKFQIEWDVDLDKAIIHFYIEVETKGFVGFGISRNGGMTGADIIIAGVYDNGTHYFSDRHGVGNQEPVIDAQQDWVLNCISDNGTHTSLNVSRPLNTCDEIDDVEITGDTTKVIWSYGLTDTIIYHGANRGSYSVNLLDPPMPPFDESNVDKWLIVANATMPRVDTTYWCSIHKTPDSYTSKRHIVGFNTKLEGDVNLKHTHHFVVYKCTPDLNKNLTAEESFGRFVGKDGNACFDAPDENTIPFDLCNGIVYAWAVGGRMMTLPENVGYPITEEGSEYYMVEMHYDNPDLVEGVRVVSTLEVYNTAIPRPIEAGIAVVMQLMTYSHILPPNVESYVTTAHCSNECTGNGGVPETGATIFNILLHSHKAGRKMKFRHFRNGTELPWIANDDNYDFNFQQNRPLREMVKILPDDHLTVECTTSTTNRTGVTMAGYGTMEEMCQTIFWIYPRNSFPGCQSVYNETLFLNRFGIESLEPEWSVSKMRPPLITAPEELAGKSYLDVLGEAMKDWTAVNVTDLENETRYNNIYNNLCGNNRENPPASYPAIDKPYVPTNPCLQTHSLKSKPMDIVAPTCRAPDPGDRTTLNPGDRTTLNPGDRTTLNPGDRTTLNPGDRTTLNPGDRTTLNPGDRTTLNPGDRTTLNPGDRTTLNPGDRTTLNPGDRTTLNPGDRTTLNPGDRTTLNPGNSSSTRSALPYLFLFSLISVLLLSCN